MTNPISKAGKKLFAQDPDVRQYAAADTAYEEGEYVPVQQEGESADRRKRDLPPGLSERDEAILYSVKRRASVLDKSFKLCGARFGWTFIIAIVPLVGDALTPALGYIFVVHQARKAKIPRSLTRRMILNLAISTSIGIVPGIGAVFLASYRANLRNAGLLEKFLAMRGERAAKAAQSATPEEETKRDSSDDKDCERPGRVGEISGDKPGEGSNSEGHKEKSTTTGEDDVEKNTIVASDSAGVQRRYLRPQSGSLEFVQQRDSRFIEDVS